MENFSYEAWDAQGQRYEGCKQAQSQEDVLSWLRDEGLTPVSVSPITQPIKKKKPSQRYKKVKSVELAAFCWQLSTMLEGGVPITTAFETIADDMGNPYFTYALQQIANDLQRGESLFDSMKQFPRVFNNLFCAMIQAGETSGSISTALRRLAEYCENRDKLASKVKSALAYPAFVVGFIILIVVVLMAFIIPRFSAIFEEMDGELPAFTRAFMSFYEGVSQNVPAILIIGLIIGGGFVICHKTKKGHEKLSRLVLSLPLFGKILINAFVATFCKTLSTLLDSGVPILEAFGILSNMTNNDVIKTAIVQTREMIVEGSNISISMSATGFFPNVAIKMTQVGEESGSLPAVLDKTSEHYERKVNAMVSTLIGMLEPALIVVVGAIVLVVVLAMYLPIFTMSGMGA